MENFDECQWGILASAVVDADHKLFAPDTTKMLGRCVMRDGGHLRISSMGPLDSNRT